MSELRSVFTVESLAMSSSKLDPIYTCSDNFFFLKSNSSVYTSNFVPRVADNIFLYFVVNLVFERYSTTEKINFVLVVTYLLSKTRVKLDF